MDKSKIKNNLAFLSQSDFSNPFEEKEESKSSIPSGVIVSMPELPDDKKSKSKIGDIVTDYLQNTMSMIDDFDDGLESYVKDSENRTLRNSLISMGRKYARDFAVGEDSSEVTRAFSKQERMLDEIVTSMEERSSLLNKEITYQLTKRTAKDIRGISELVDSQSTVENIKLSAIKEMNKVAKDKLDLRMKLAEKKKEEDNASMKYSSMVQSILGNGTGSISRAPISQLTGHNDETDPVLSDFQNEGDSREYIAEENLSSEDEMEDDRFIKYDGMNIKLVLCINSRTKQKWITAEDNDGNTIDDYPIPDISDLEFITDDSIGEATDQLYRTYKLRYV